jgi:putative MATE family efflux protein
MYGMVDGFFVSNYVGKTAFAAVNLVMPFAMGVSVIGFMLGTGGSAVVSRTLGEGDRETAQKYFSMFVYTGAVLGTVLGILSIAFMPYVVRLLGAEGELYDFCVLYGRVMMISTPGFILQVMFQSFFVTAEKPRLSLFITLTAGISNMFLDWLLVGVLNKGIVGAAAATVTCEFIGGLTPLVYFFMKNDSLLMLRKCKIYGKVLMEGCFNGLSEMVTNLSTSIVNIVYNFQLMNYIGEDGVSAYGIIMYVNFAFTAVLLGYAVGSAPLTGYHYGAKDHAELKNLFRKGIMLMLLSGIAMAAAAEVVSEPLVRLFAGYDAGLCSMTTEGFRIYALSFSVMGINIWASSFFTSLSNGRVSAAISFIRTFVFQIIMVLILPAVWGIKGIWSAVVVAESLSLVISAAALIKNGKKYQYI